MHEDLRVNKYSILHSKLPSELLTNSGTTSPPPDRIINFPHKPAIDVDSMSKMQRVANPSNWHPKITAALKRPLQKAGSRTFTKSMRFCKKDAYSIFHNGYPVWAPNTFLELVYSTRSALKSTPRPWMHRSNLSWTCWRTSRKTPSKLMHVGNVKIKTYLPRVISYVTLDATM